ncbi:prepilin-type N-terminal cleavage/methylation domain-containing protein [Pseudomonas luteola]|uniref:PilW family protein n=1 Tax=Pseudomonas luteola TaxID=47886 RepID=UPI001EF6B849|nr:prepilin-type N-terminal cleavage/methylation domain-containing protein [Pseudomonas luteola]MCG7372584.1 prepilin-type N-terminal cleavage/methylation domain-containing protein [Pseudomonas luteola]
MFATIACVLNFEMNQINSHSKQAGLSLIEIMVALTISCFLILGVSQIYITNKRSYAFQQSQANNQDNSRFALMVLEQQLARTGYRADPLKNNMIQSFPEAKSIDSCPSFQAGQTYQIAKLKTDRDSICFRYQGAEAPNDADWDLDCLGNSIPSGKVIVSRITYSSTDSKITCTAQGKTATLVTGLTDFKWFVLPNTNDSAVQSIRYAALFSSQNNVQDGISSDAINRWNALTGSNLDNNGKKLYQISQSTVALRNLMP